MNRTILKKWIVTLVIILLHLNFGTQGMENKDPTKFDNKIVEDNESSGKNVKPDSLNVISQSKRKSKVCYRCDCKNAPSKNEAITLKKNTNLLNEVGLNEQLLAIIMGKSENRTDLANPLSTEFYRKYGNDQLNCDDLVNLLLTEFWDKYGKDQLIRHLMTKDKNNKWTALHVASSQGQEGVVRWLFHPFNEEKDYKYGREYVMQEDDNKKNDSFTSCFTSWKYKYRRIVVYFFQ